MTLDRTAAVTSETPSPAEQVLHRIAADYFEGCRSYAAAAAPDTPERVFWRIRLVVLAEVGDWLADALEVAAPDWEFMHLLTDPEATR